MAGADRRRMLTVWWAHWPVVAAGLASGTALDRAAIVLHANRVVACSPAATAAGVAIGQRRRVAQQRCPEAVLLDHDPDRDARMFDAVVRAVGEYTPRLEIVEPGWLCIEARGPSRYFGGDEQLAQRLVASVSTAIGRAAGGRGAGIGIADGRFASAVAARLAARDSVRTARGSGARIVDTGGSAAFLTGQPVAWLRETGEVDAELVSLFARLGLSTLGALAALPRVDVSDRFGPAGEWAHRLASGDDGRPSLAVDPPEERGVERVFEDPVVQLQPLVFVGKQLADELTESLTLTGLACTRLVVVAETEHGERSERVWYRARGLSAAAMVERIRWQLDGWTAQPGGLSAGIVLLRLDPNELRHDGGDQLRLWGGLSATDERAVRTVARLAGLAGEDSVLVPAWQGGRLPGDRYRWVPATTTDLADADDTAARLRPQLDTAPASRRRRRKPAGRTKRAAAADTAAEAVAAAARLGPWPGSLPVPSPAVVLGMGESVAESTGLAAVVADEHGRAIVVSGRGELSAPPATLTIDDGVARAITAWAGPWPLDERWWDERRHRRLARFQLVTADGAAHLVVVERRQWRLLASYA